MKLQELQENRSQALAALRTLTDTIETEKREPTEQEAVQFTDHEKEVRSLNTRIERQRFLEDQERAEPVAKPRRGHDGALSSRCREFRITRAMAAQLEPGSVDAGSEREISAELARRDGKKPQGILIPHEALQTRALLTSGDGAALYPERHRDDLYIDRLREQLQVARLGATVLSGLTGNQDIPRLTGSATATWVGEHEAVPASDAAFDSVMMTPRTVGAETEYSRRMIINASPDIETLMRNDLSSVVGTAIDRAALTGDGAGNAPTGILNTAGIGAVDLSGGVTWESLLQFIEQLTTDRALNGRLGWLVPPKFVTAARSTVRSSTGTDVMVMESPGQLAGYPLLQSNHMPTDGGTVVDDGNGNLSGGNEVSVVFGAWQDLLIGYWSSVDILLNPYHSDVYSRGGVKINALQDVDIAVRHPESFVAGTGLAL